MDIIQVGILVVSYLVGSIPTGVILARSFNLPDPRSHGSKNIGASNMARVGGAKIGALTFICDFLKGLLPCLFVKFYFSENADLAAASALLAILGHCFSIFLWFSGGKGVATAAGAFLPLEPVSAIASIVVWILVFLDKRVSSLAAAISMAVMIFMAFATSSDPAHKAVMCIGISLIIRKHDKNWEDLLNFKERSF